MIALVTGGGGFLGRAIVERLVARGDTVRSYARGDYPDLRGMGVECFRGDLAEGRNLRSAVDGCDVVFHVAAKAGVWGPFIDYHRANVVATQHVLDAVRAAGVPRLVFTSSPSVVFDGRDLEGVDESLPYPPRYEAAYPQTKAVAEQIVRAAASAALATVALRPHLIWGPRDNHLVPRLLARASSLRRVGGINKLIDSTYIDNAADAHLAAADRLQPGCAVSGRAYFISNGEPRPLWDLVNGILAAAKLPPVTRNVPLGIARGAAAILEATYAAFRLPGEPRLTRFVVQELTTAHWFNLDAAQRDLGYAPTVSIDEGLARLTEWLRNE